MILITLQCSALIITTLSGYLFQRTGVIITTIGTLQHPTIFIACFYNGLRSPGIRSSALVAAWRLVLTSLPQHSTLCIDCRIAWMLPVVLGCNRREQILHGSAVIDAELSAKQMAHGGAHACQEFICTEWLGYIVVSPDCEHENHLCHRTSCAQHEKRNTPKTATNPTTKILAGLPWPENIENDKPRFRLMEDAHRGRTQRDTGDAVASWF